MQNRNMYLKLGFIGFLVLFAFITIYPPQDNLKGGIDLVGGHSLLMEFDTTGLESTHNLSTEGMRILRQRVDPEGVRNLVWRPVGDTRLEIQMPLTARSTIEKRDNYQSAIETLRDTNINTAQLEFVLSLPEPVRGERLAQFVNRVPAREAILADVVQAYDAWQTAVAEGRDFALVEDMEQNYQVQLDRLMATNVNLNALNSLLDTAGRQNEQTIESFIAGYPERETMIRNIIDSYREWAQVKGPLDDPSDLLRLLRGAGVLEFRILPRAEREMELSGYIERLEERGPRPRPEDRFAWYELANEDATSGGIVREWDDRYWVLAYAHDPARVLDSSRPGWELRYASPSRDQHGLPSVSFGFNDIGASYFQVLTRSNIDEPLAIVLDGKVYSAPRIVSAIGHRGEITGQFTSEEVSYLVSTLNAGSLKARLKDNPISVNSIGPSLGQDNLNAGLKAGIYGVMAVILFMAVYYMFAGLIADFAMLLNLFLLLSAMVILEATFTMAGVAGVILSMGMAVDANVLIYERMREEAGKLQSLKLIIKNGYDRALPTIIDSNITTIITCVVLYYIGTEEIKGFALTLGLGLVINIFTAVFVTKNIFNALVGWGVLRSLPMMQLFKRPNINWLGKQKYFFMISIALVAMGLVMFPLRGESKYDIEFRGGTAIGVEMKESNLLSISDMRERVGLSGQSLINTAEAIRRSEVSPDQTLAGSYTMRFSNVSPTRVEQALISFMDDVIERGSIRVHGANTLSFVVQPEKKMSAEAIGSLVTGQVARQVEQTGRELAVAQVQSIGQEGLSYEIVTAATSQHLVTGAILETMGPYLNVQPPIEFDPEIKAYPITSRRLGDDIGEANVPGYVPDYLGGVALVIDDVSPSVTLDQVKARLLAMRNQPDFENVQWRNFDVIGLAPAENQDLAGLPLDQIEYTRLAVVVADENYPYDEDETLWQTALVTPEMTLVHEALSRTSELQKVNQFAAQVAHQTRIAAIVALAVAFAAIALYLWIRFGTLRHGLAANIAIVHDIIVAAGFVMISAYLAQTALGRWLMIDDFKINLTLVAAFLTILGYSVNDTIVVFDRIRENRTKHRELNPAMINDAINQTLSRTVLTGLTTLLVMTIMYIFGGQGVRGFTYVMILGTFIGTYSSIAVAAPLLIRWGNVMGYSSEDTAKSIKMTVSDEPVTRGA